MLLEPVMIGNNLMNDIRVDKDELLKTLNTNLENHTSTLKKAMSARNTEIKKQLSELLLLMESSVDFQAKETITFPMPDDHTNDYERVIKMVKMSVDEVIELNESQFDQLVLDNWHWKKEFMFKSAGYLGG